MKHKNVLLTIDNVPKIVGGSVDISSQEHCALRVWGTKW